jgi:hypothetical protein
MPGAASGPPGRGDSPQSARWPSRAGTGLADDLAVRSACRRAILVCSAGQQADGGQASRETAPQMPLRGRSSHRLSIRNMRVTWWSYGDSNSGPLACHESLTGSLTMAYAA